MIADTYFTELTLEYSSEEMTHLHTAEMVES